MKFYLFEGSKNFPFGGIWTLETKLFYVNEDIQI